MSASHEQANSFLSYVYIVRTTDFSLYLRHLCTKYASLFARRACTRLPDASVGCLLLIIHSDEHTFFYQICFVFSRKEVSPTCSLVMRISGWRNKELEREQEREIGAEWKESLYARNDEMTMFLITARCVHITREKREAYGDRTKMSEVTETLKGEIDEPKEPEEEAEKQRQREQRNKRNGDQQCARNSNWTGNNSKMTKSDSLNSSEDKTKKSKDNLNKKKADNGKKGEDSEKKRRNDLKKRRSNFLKHSNTNKKHVELQT